MYSPCSLCSSCKAEITRGILSKVSSPMKKNLRKAVITMEPASIFSLEAFSAPFAFFFNPPPMKSKLDIDVPSKSCALLLFSSERGMPKSLWNFLIWGNPTIVEAIVECGVMSGQLPRALMPWRSSVLGLRLLKISRFEVPLSFSDNAFRCSSLYMGESSREAATLFGDWEEAAEPIDCFN